MNREQKLERLFIAAAFEPRREKEFDWKPFELQAAFWDEFRDWWNGNWRDLFGQPLTMSARYEYRDKRWREFKERMIAEGRLSASSSSMHPSP